MALGRLRHFKERFSIAFIIIRPIFENSWTIKKYMLAFENWNGLSNEPHNEENTLRLIGTLKSERSVLPSILITSKTVEAMTITYSELNISETNCKTFLTTVFFPVTGIPIIKDSLGHS